MYVRDVPRASYINPLRFQDRVVIRSIELRVILQMVYAILAPPIMAINQTAKAYTTNLFYKMRP